MIDVWRKMFLFEKQFPWRQLSLNIFSRLDYWLLTDSMLCCMQTTEIKPAPKAIIVRLL